MRAATVVLFHKGFTGRKRGELESPLQGIENCGMTLNMKSTTRALSYGGPALMENHFHPNKYFCIIFSLYILRNVANILYLHMQKISRGYSPRKIGNFAPF